MENYLLTNIIVSILIIITFTFLKNAPARLRFYLLLGALFSWLVPWQNALVSIPVKSIVPAQVSTYSQELVTFVSLETNTIEDVAQSSAKSSAESSPTLIEQTPANSSWLDGLSISFEGVLIVSLLIGLVLFAKDIWLYQRQINHWLRHSTPLPNLFRQHGVQISSKEQHIPICLVEGDGPGMATGIFKPTIWLATYHYNSEHSKTIITHELNHIRQHDPLWMWLITLTQRLLWWNPIAYYLAEQAREQIELSCDEKCAVELDEEYAHQLANIVLVSNGQQNFKPILGIKHSNNFNIKRLKRLSGMHKMKMKYVIITTATLALSAFSALAINGGSKQSTAPIQTAKAIVDEFVNLENGIYKEETIAAMSLQQLMALRAEIIPQLPNKKLNSIFNLVTHNIIKNDPSLLTQLIQDSQSWRRLAVLREAFSALAQQTSLQEAWNLASSLGPGSEEPIISSNELQSARFGILRTFSNDINNLKGLLDFLSAFEGENKRGYIGTVVNASSRLDLTSTRQQIMNLPAGEDKRDTMRYLIRIWNEQNANEVMDWLMNNPDVADYYLVRNTAEQLLKQNGFEAISDYYQNSDSDDIKQHLASAAVKYYVTSDIQKSIYWLKAMNNPSYQLSSLSSALRELGYEQNMDQHIQLIESVYSDDNFARATVQYRRTLSAWSEYEPEKVRAYVENLPAERAQLKEYLITQLKL